MRLALCAEGEREPMNNLSDIAVQIVLCAVVLSLIHFARK